MNPEEIAELKQLIEFLKENGIGEFDLERGDLKVRLPRRSGAAGEVADAKELERLYLELWDEVEPGRGFTRPGRQILHCTFGSVLTDPLLGPDVRGTVEHHIDTYTEVLADHFGRHLDALRAGM